MPPPPTSPSTFGLMALAYMRPRLHLPPSPHRAQLEALPIPRSFDARTAFPSCVNTIGRIRNQGHCGSCWAFGAVESFADRICIKENSTVTLSAQSLLDCDAVDNGCHGGFLDSAWKGLVSRGALEESCDPYTHCAYPPLANCTRPPTLDRGMPPKDDFIFARPDQHHTGEPTAPPQQCPRQCAGGVGGLAPPLKWHKAASAYAVAEPGDVSAMQRELMAHGPFEVSFFVYSDFYAYSGGVYKKASSAKGPMGGHAVKLVGWGDDADGGPYWLVANSWSPSWGEGGFFRIVRGSNECGIETTPAAGLPAAPGRVDAEASVDPRPALRSSPPVRPTLQTQFTATVRTGQADHGPDGEPGDGCIIARPLKPAPHTGLKLGAFQIWFDAPNTRIAQEAESAPGEPATRTVKTIDRYDLPSFPSLLVEPFFNETVCYAKRMQGMCRNGTSECPPNFGHFGDLATPFTNTLGMYYLNTSLLELHDDGVEVWQWTDDHPTLMPNGSTVIITRNYTYHVAPAPAQAASHQNGPTAPRPLKRLEWTQGLPNGGSHDARLCTVIDFTQEYVGGAPPVSAFEPVGGVASCVWP